MYQVIPRPRPCKIQETFLNESNWESEYDQLEQDIQQAFASAVIREGLQDNTALDFNDGNVRAAAKELNIDLIAEVRALRLERENKRVNDAMDQADRDDGGVYYDIDDLTAQ